MASVSCTVNNFLKYWPLIKLKEKKLSQSEFQEWLINSFDSDTVAKINTKLQTGVTIFSPSEAPLDEDLNNFDLLFVGQDAQKQKLINRFKSEIFRRTIFNPEKNEFLSPENIGENIVAYRKEIIDSLSQSNPEQTIKTLSDLRKALGIRTTDERDEYIMAVYFDQLIEREFDFIKVDARRSLLDKQRYVFAGPHANYDTHFATSEYSDASEKTSKFVQMVLEAIPQADSKGRALPGTSVGLNGFMSATGKLKTWARRVSNWSDTPNVADLINQYLSPGTSFLRSERTILIPHLHGIRAFLFSDKTPTYIKNLFTRAILRSEPSTYVEYINDDGNFKPSFLTERAIMVQVNSLLDTFLGVQALYQDNPNTGYSIIRQGSTYKVVSNNQELLSFDIVTKTVTRGTKNIDVTSIKSINSVNGDIVELAKNICQIYLPGEFKSYYNNANAIKAEDDKKYLNQLTQLIAWQVASIYNDMDTQLLKSVLKPIAKAMGLYYGSELKFVITNAEGNNVPMFQLPSLAYRTVEIHKRRDDGKLDNPSSINPISYNIQNIRAPYIRSTIQLNEKNTIAIKDLPAKDLYYLAIFQDFLYPLVNSISSQADQQDKGVIGIQSHTYSDKSKQYIQSFDLKNWNFSADPDPYNLAAGLVQYIEKGDVTAINALKAEFKTSQQDFYNQLLDRVVADYEKVYGKSKTPLKSYTDKINFIVTCIGDKGPAQLRADFAIANEGKGVDFIDELHYSKKGKFNSTLKFFLDVFNNDKLFNEFIAVNYEFFRKEVPKSVTDQIGIGPALDRSLYAYFLTDVYLSTNYNQYIIGDVIYHPDKDSTSEKEYDIVSQRLFGKPYEQLSESQREIFKNTLGIASRLNAQSKRMVIYGATYEPYLQGLKYGMPEFVQYSVIDDVKANVFNATGTHDQVDACDGGGFTSPYTSRWENQSLMDAALGNNKKTIYHDIDPYTNKPTLFKWAEYAITNEKRRKSYRSNTSFDDLFTKMHSQIIPAQVKNNVTWNSGILENYYIKPNGDPFSEYKKVKTINIENGEITVTFDDNTSNITEFNSIADIDKAFGGAWTATMQNRRFIGTEYSLDLVNKVICENNLKDYVISFAVNSSACKVGTINLNVNDSWKRGNNTPWKTARISTRFGGPQMDSDHEIDESEVSEMTQMISALAQDGNAQEIVRDIYTDIGEHISTKMSELQTATTIKDIARLKQIFGKAVIESFTSNDRATLGLAQAFIARAQSEATEQGLGEIPFSSQSINGIFNSTVITHIIKNAIRRKYAGLQAILHPGYNTMMYYQYKGNTLLFEDLVKVLKSENKELTIESFDQLQQEVDPSKSGFITRLNTSDILPEDTIIIRDGAIGYRSVVIDNFEKYFYYRNVYSGPIYRNQLIPINLQGARTEFTVKDATNTYTKSLYDTPITLALSILSHVNVRSDETFSQAFIRTGQELYAPFNDPNVNARLAVASSLVRNQDDIKQANERLRLLQQNFLNALERGISATWYDNVRVTIGNPVIRPAQVILPKQFATQYRLQQGDSLFDITKDPNAFFNSRVRSFYAIPKISEKTSYDAILFDGKGDTLIVKIDPTVTKANNTTVNYEIINNRVYINNQELCSADNKSFTNIADADGNLRCLCTVKSVEQLAELYNTGRFTAIVYSKDCIDDNKLKKTNAEGNTVVIETNINGLITSVTKSMVNDFNKSLRYIGVRIPCQNQTSFAPMSCVGFLDSDDNVIHLPPTITWLQGSDYDIDKQFLLSYDVNKRGAIVTDTDKFWEKEVAIKNKVVDGIWQVVTNPKTQINLTTPVTVDPIKDAAKSSPLGIDAKLMSPFIPTSRYKLQVENATGKDVIGVDATAIKSFFALSYMYNEMFATVMQQLSNGDYAAAGILLDQLVGRQKDTYYTLPNVNRRIISGILDLANQHPNDRNCKEIVVILQGIQSFENHVDNVADKLGQLLNCATDNAKELILKKINSDKNWADIYAIALMRGESFTEIAKFMIDPDINTWVNGFTSSILDDTRNYDIVLYLQTISKSGLDKSQQAKIDKLLTYAEAAQELRILGKLLKINQGIPTKIGDLFNYINSINKFVSQRCLKIQTPNKEQYRLQYEKQHFDFIRFLTDTFYQKMWIQEYEAHKLTFNILNVVTSVPHFYEMFKSLAIAQQTLALTSVSNNLMFRVWNTAANYYANDYRNNMTEQLRKDVSRFLISEWLASKNIVIQIPKNFKYRNANNDVVASNDASLSIGGDTDSQINFLRWVEENIFKKLRKEYAENEFVKHLTVARKYINGERRPIYTLSIDMLAIESAPDLIQRYERIQQGFEDIRKQSVDGLTVNGQTLTLGDIIYLYNLYVHEDRFNKHSFTRLFETTILQDSDNTSLAKEFNYWIDHQNAYTLHQTFFERWISNDGGRLNLTQRVQIGNSIFYIRGNGVYDSDLNAVTDKNKVREVLIEYDTIRGTCKECSYNGKTYLMLSNGAILTKNDNDEWINPALSNSVKNEIVSKMQPRQFQLQVDTEESISVDNDGVVQITYRVNDKTNSYTIRNGHIYNAAGNEVYQKDSVVRNKILAKAAVKLGQARIVWYWSNDMMKQIPYVVYNDNRILSSTTGNFVYSDNNHGHHKGIMRRRNSGPILHTRELTMAMSYIKDGVDYRRSSEYPNTTFDAIKAGLRTATTRSNAIADYYANLLNVGDQIYITRQKGSNNPDDKILVQITGLQWIKKDGKVNISAEEWSKKEGWSESYFNERITTLDRALQIDYKVVETPTVTEQPKSEVMFQRKQQRYNRKEMLDKLMLHYADRPLRRINDLMVRGVAIKREFSNIVVNLVMGETSRKLAERDAEALRRRAIEQLGIVAKDVYKVHLPFGYKLQINLKSRAELVNAINKRTYRFLDNLSDDELLSEVMRLEAEENEPDLMYHISKDRLFRALSDISKANPNITQWELNEALEYLHDLKNNPKNNEYVKACLKWLESNTVRLPSGKHLCEEAFETARQHSLDPSKYESPWAVFDATISKLGEAKPIDPFAIDEFKFTYSKNINGLEVQVFTVSNTPEGQQAIVQAICDTTPKDPKTGKLPWADFSSPWCTTTYNYNSKTGKATVTESAKNRWKQYVKDSSYCQIAFINGYPVAKNVLRQGHDEWWDYKDTSYNSLEACDLTCREKVFKQVLPLYNKGYSIGDFSIYSNRYVYSDGTRSLLLTERSVQLYRNHTQLNIDEIIDVAKYIPFATEWVDLPISLSPNQLDLIEFIKSEAKAKRIIKPEVLDQAFSILDEYNNPMLYIRQFVDNRIAFMEDLSHNFNKDAYPEVYNRLLEIQNGAEIGPNEIWNLPETYPGAINVYEPVSQDYVTAIEHDYMGSEEELGNQDSEQIDELTTLSVEEVDAILSQTRDTLERLLGNPIEEQTRNTDELEPIDESALTEVTNTVNEESDKRIFSKDIIHRLLQGFKDYDVNTLYNKYMEEEVRQNLKPILLQVLKEYNVEVLQGAIQDTFGDDVISAFDVLNKVIYLSEDPDQNTVTFPEEFAHAFIKFMGAVYHKPENRERFPETKLYSELRDLVTNTAIYRETFLQYHNLPEYQFKNGKPNLPKIKEEALGKALATVLVKRYDEQNDTSFFNKLKNWFKTVLMRFKTIFSDTERFNMHLEEIADSILDGTYRTKVLDKINDQNYKLQDYSNTIKTSVKNDGGVALGILTDAISSGGIITGSLAYRKQTPVYRENTDDLHDIDVIVERGNHNWFDIHPYWHGGRVAENRMISQEQLLKDVEKVTFIKQLRSKQPNLHPMCVFANNEGDVIIPCMICENTELVDRFKSLTGNYNSRLSQFTEDERKQMYIVDVFLKKNDYNDGVLNDDEFGLRLTDYQQSFREKLKYGRAKDIYDYQKLNPYYRHYQMDKSQLMDLTERIEVSSIPSVTNSVEPNTLESEVYSDVETISTSEEPTAIATNDLPTSNRRLLQFAKAHPDVVIMISNSELNSSQFSNLEISARAFIKNGKIYFNTTADDSDLFHELGHIYMAKLKNDKSSQAAYYNLLDHVKETRLYKELQRNPNYANKRGSDFDEEVLAHLMTQYYRGELSITDETSIAVINEALQLISLDELSRWMDDETLDMSVYFNSNVELMQKVATLKNRLFKENQIQENCN